MVGERTKLWAIAIVVLCTIFTSFGQLFWKKGADKLVFSIPSLVANWPLLLGFVLYGVGLVLFVISLKGGSLSVLFPFISLSFVWVSLLSLFFLGESMSLINWFGVASIIAGVSFIGGGSV